MCGFRGLGFTGFDVVLGLGLDNLLRLQGQWASG